MAQHEGGGGGGGGGQHLTRPPALPICQVSVGHRGGGGRRRVQNGGSRRGDVEAGAGRHPGPRCTAGAAAVGRGCSPSAAGGGGGGGGSGGDLGTWDQPATAASEGVHREAADGSTRNVDHGRRDVQPAVGTRLPRARPTRRGRFATGPALGHSTAGGSGPGRLHSHSGCLSRGAVARPPGPGNRTDWRFGERQGAARAAPWAGGRTGAPAPSVDSEKRSFNQRRTGWGETCAVVRPSPFSIQRQDPDARASRECVQPG